MAFTLHAAIPASVKLLLGPSTVIRVLGLLAMAAVLAWAGDPGARLFKQARQAEEAGRYVEAYILYSKARALAPADGRFAVAAEAVRNLAAQTLAAAGKLEPALALAPANPLLQSAKPKPPAVVAPVGDAELQELRRMKPPVQLEPERKVTDFALKGTILDVYEKVARAFGLEVMFDSEYQGKDQIRFDLQDCDFTEAILALNDVAKTFVVPVNAKMFMVAADNDQKRLELEPRIAVMVPIPDTMTAEEATQLAQAVQQSLDMKRLMVDTARRQIFMRDTVTRVRIAQALLRHLAKPKAEMMLDVELISVSDTSTLNLGLGLPSAFPVENLSTIWNNQPSIADGITALLGIGGGKTLFGIAVGAANVVATKLAGEARLLSRFQVRATNGMPAKLHIGERYPIVNARFSAIVVDDQIQNSIDNGTFREPFPSFTFEDLGLVLEFTPQIHSAHAVSLDMQVQFRLLTGETANEVPVISNREMKTFVRLEEGQLALISGVSVSQTFKVRSGVAGLSEIPWLGNLFTRHTRDEMMNDLLVLVRPYVIRLPPAEGEPSLTLRFGPEGRPLSGI